MSAMPVSDGRPEKGDLSLRAKDDIRQSFLFDHLVGDLLEMSRHLKTKRLRRLEVDN